MSKALQIKDFPDYYVTDTGDVYSRNYHKTGRVKKLKPVETAHGYLAVHLFKDNKRHQKHVHRLVAETFVSNPKNKPEINHIDGDKQNNCATNLEFVTHLENITHAIFVLRGRRVFRTVKTYKQSSSSKPVLQLKNGEVIAEFPSIAEARRATGIDSLLIIKCCKNKQQHTHGYQWKYKQRENV